MSKWDGAVGVYNLAGQGKTRTGFLIGTSKSFGYVWAAAPCHPDYALVRVWAEGLKCGKCQVLLANKSSLEYIATDGLASSFQLEKNGYGGYTPSQLSILSWASLWLGVPAEHIKVEINL